MQTFLAIALLLTIWLSPLLAQPQPSEPTPTASRTEIILLGTGTPYPDPNSSGPATAVVVDGRVFLFDAGAGVMRRMNAAKLPLSGPEAVFITHLHSDHTLGYADLILTSWIMRRAKPFPVYGPPGLRRMTNHLLAALRKTLKYARMVWSTKWPAATALTLPKRAPAWFMKRTACELPLSPFHTEHGKTLLVIELIRRIVQL